MTQDFTNQLSALSPTLRAFTRRFTTNREESQDLVQDTLMKALLYKDKFREDTNLKGWLFTIMRNTFINNYRKHQRARTSPDFSKDQHVLHVRDEHTFSSPERQFEYADAWTKIEFVREELLLPFKMHTSGYKYNEIAEHLGIPMGTVKNRIFQARKEIQRLLES